MFFFLESFCWVNMLSPSPSPQHKSHSEEPSYARPFNDRKRKFVDSELALDTEGNWLSPKPHPHITAFFSAAMVLISTLWKASDL